VNCGDFKCQISTDKICNSTILLSEASKLDYFTIIFNLVHNATRFEAYTDYNKASIQSVVIESQIENESYKISITNPGLISDGKMNFINTGEFDSTVQKTNGLAISRRLAIKYGWELVCSKPENDYTTIFTIKIR
jgi:hypothetical protein